MKTIAIRKGPLCWLLLGLLIWLPLLRTPAFPADSVRVGVLLPLTGKLAEAGRMEEKAFMMAVDEINDQGGVRGRRVSLIKADTAGDKETGKAAMERLIGEEGVQVVSGGISSTAALAAASVAEKHKVPFLVCTASANEITEKGWGCVFRLSPSLSEHPKSLTSFLQRALRIRNAAVLCEDSPFGRYGLKQFSARSKAMGLDIILIRHYEPGSTDFSSFLNKMPSKNPQMICMISQAGDAAFFLWQCRSAEVHPMLFFGRGPGFDLQEFREIAGELSDYVCSTTLWAPSVLYPGAGDFHERFVTRFGHPPDYHGAQAYAAMQVLKAAFDHSETLGPKEIQEALSRTETATVFGPVKFESQGRMARQNRLPTLVVQWIDGKLETVWPREVASAQVVFPFPGWNPR